MGLLMVQRVAKLTTLNKRRPCAEAVETSAKLPNLVPLRTFGATSRCSPACRRGRGKTSPGPRSVSPPACCTSGCSCCSLSTTASPAERSSWPRLTASYETSLMASAPRQASCSCSDPSASGRVTGTASSLRRRPMSTDVGQRLATPHLRARTPTRPRGRRTRARRRRSRFAQGPWRPPRSRRGRVSLPSTRCPRPGRRGSRS